ncbi:MAG: tRNA pseudouridine(55) synthase TruB [Pikeienuella sp.]
MARRKKGREVNGWLIVDKPRGVTSTQVVGRARWAFDAQKAGHAGTLDPLASGLLAVAFGEATKTVPFAQEGLKTYQFTARWGQATTTDDQEGEICAEADLRPTADQIEAILAQFTGDIMQTPPVFSAIKVDGARAYDLARKGEEVALAARPIWIESLKLISQPDADHAIFEMVCGKGGYVRSMARDIGDALGCFAHVADLRRLSSGGFDLNGSMGFEALEALKGDETRDTHLMPVESGLSGIQEVSVNELTAELLSNGRADAAPQSDANLYWAGFNGHVIAVIEKNELMQHQLLRVFHGWRPVS